MVAETSTAHERALYVENTGIWSATTETDITTQLALILLEFTFTTADEQGASKLLPETVRTLARVESMRVACSADSEGG
jgi:hypothetical protein